MFTDEHLTAMLPVLAAVCADFDAALMEFNGEADHVHLLVEYPPTIQLSRLVNSLTGLPRSGGCASGSGLRERPGLRR